VKKIEIQLASGIGCAALAVSMILLLGLKAIDNTYAKTAT